jgi:hypothetical protein
VTLVFLSLPITPVFLPITINNNNAAKIKIVFLKENSFFIVVNYTQSLSFYKGMLNYDLSILTSRIIIENITQLYML